MKKFSCIFLVPIISCANPPEKNQYLESPRQAIEITSIEKTEDENVYNVLLNYRITNFDPVKRKYICMYKQLVNGKMKFGTRSVECKIDAAEGQAQFSWKPKKHYERLPIIVHDKTPGTEIFHVAPPYEISVSLFWTPNSDKCWKINSRNGKKYWGCGYGPLTDWYPKTTIEDS
jgi:hypothetical protein